MDIYIYITGREREHCIKMDVIISLQQFTREWKNLTYESNHSCRLIYSNYTFSSHAWLSSYSNNLRYQLYDKIISSDSSSGTSTSSQALVGLFPLNWCIF